MFPIVTYVVSYAVFLFNSAATLLNLPPTMGHKYPNDELTTYDHNDESLCRRCELMRTVTKYIKIIWLLCVDAPE